MGGWVGGWVCAGVVSVPVLCECMRVHVGVCMCVASFL